MIGMFLLGAMFWVTGAVIGGLVFGRMIRIANRRAVFERMLNAAAVAAENAAAQGYVNAQIAELEKQFTSGDAR